MKDEVAVLYTTWPDAESAAAAGRTLVRERLCACVNVLAPMRSIYRWEDALEEATEIPALIKTTAARAEAARDRILALHPYETACVLAVTIKEKGSAPAFLKWIQEEAAPSEA